ncbi:MAG: hypothetical protein HY512_00330 [Candidatus Aenigmarchaeota archaeon]|nr:hypothetical protein [Candidatus Aenigmarchaeota archaeon]
MPEYNAAFFNGLTAVVIALKKRYGEAEAIDVMREVFSSRLKAVYDKLGFVKGSTEDFVRAVGENDRMLGLKVEFKIEQNKIIYRFHTDPFPLLKGQIDPTKFDDAYLRFKVEYILGNEWKYTTTKHFWRGDPFTEHVIERTS